MKINYKFIAFVLIAGLVLTGCTAGPAPSPQKGPAPIYDENGNVLWQPLPGDQTRHQPRPQPENQEISQEDNGKSSETRAQVPQSRPAPRIGAQDNPEPVSGDSHLLAAVTPLADQAEQQMEAGELDRAFATAERAVRIDPYNAKLWNLMARIQFKQENYSQAEQLAKKSNLLAKNDRELKSLNWKIIAAVLSQQGKEDQAGDALQKAQEYE
ncbi:Tetratricopeptide repeat-containing protein [Desulfonema limicola]|uniref:Tetratricopeptide repeat-containing protein n=1 Tax=Desulfonema limicola TaxID=45656 RepID=A0A975GFJ4_9BACT|nr:tetratricopeptide repeat protein [Desulfonema limicola]QTA79303.1 Tetratricopeptide repeat-containing protein [Desulfonema limicola]